MARFLGPQPHWLPPWPRHSPSIRFQNLPYQLVKHLPHIRPISGRNLHKFASQIEGQFFSFLIEHFSPFFLIQMCSDETDDDSLIEALSGVFYLLVPPIHALKRIPVSYAIGDDYALGLPVVASCQGPETFPSRKFPDG